MGDGLSNLMMQEIRGFKLPKPLVELIDRKNAMYRIMVSSFRKCSSTQKTLIEKQFNSLKEAVRDALCDFKLGKTKRLRLRALKANPSKKAFWRFLRSQTKRAGSFSALRHEGKMVFDQDGMEKAVLSHFTGTFKGQNSPVFDAQNHESVTSATNHSSPESRRFEAAVCSPYSMAELDKILSKLPNEKASGMDNVPNETLRHSGRFFRLYLRSFLNSILDQGYVPSELNQGKCVLIYKVKRD